MDELAQARVVVTGASGMVGTAVCDALTADGLVLTRLSRKGRGPGWATWDPDGGQFDPSLVDGARAVIHLAGEGIGDRRWSEARKQALWQSRVRSSEVLADAIRACRQRPEVIIAASGIHVYGDRGDTWLDEQSAPGDTFLARLCVAWEEAIRAPEALGVRVVNLRMGMVLSPAGGALDRMLPAFRAGVGGKLGSGRQFVPWVALEDVVGIVRFALERTALRGPVNVVAPEVVDNITFTKSLAKVLRRPAIVPVPALAIGAAFGEMGRTLLLSSVRARPQALETAGYRYRWPNLEPALAHVLRKEA